MSPYILELLASRICHDLVSPVGAVQNGVEFMEDMGADASEEALSLIAHSVKMASARLQVFRFAYGAGGRDKDIKPEDVHTTFATFLECEDKVSQNWDPHQPLGFAEPETGYCKILMSALMLAYESLPRGGEITVEAGARNETRVTATGQDAGPRPQVEEAMAQSLDPEDLDPRLVHPYVLGVLADHYGLEVRISKEHPGQALIIILHKS